MLYWSALVRGCQPRRTLSILSRHPCAQKLLHSTPDQQDQPTYQQLSLIFRKKWPSSRIIFAVSSSSVSWSSTMKPPYPNLAFQSGHVLGKMCVCTSKEKGGSWEVEAADMLRQLFLFCGDDSFQKSRPGVVKNSWGVLLARSAMSTLAGLVCCTWPIQPPYQAQAQAHAHQAARSVVERLITSKCRKDR